MTKNITTIISRPRITEKATDQSAKNAYVFEIHPEANKKDVATAIFDMFKVKPVRVNIARNPSKKVFIRGKAGIKSGIKKAYIYLKDGDKIEIV